MGRKRGFVADRDGMFSDYQAGMSQRDIARKYGINQSNVSVNLRKHPLWPSRRPAIRQEQTPRQKRKVFDLDAIMQDYIAGLSVVSIADKHGISQSWVSNQLKKHGGWRERRRALRIGCHPVVDGTRRCLTCDSVKSVDEFPKHRKSPFGILAHCKPCISNLRSAYSKSLYRELRMCVIKEYGGVCALCGFQDERAIHIDHVNNDGFIERRTTRAISLLRKLIRDGFPNTHQLLCANCNAIKAHEAGSFSRNRNSEAG